MSDLSNLVNKLRLIENKKPNQLKVTDKPGKSQTPGKGSQAHPFKGKLVGGESINLLGKFRKMVSEDLGLDGRDGSGNDGSRDHPPSFSRDHAKKHWLEKMQQFGPSTDDIDPEEYPQQDGLEGPFKFKNGRTLYYDIKKQQYYDIKLDLYLDDSELIDLLKKD